MAQVFGPSANTYSRLSLFSMLIGIPALLTFAFSGISRSSYNTKQDTALDQPVPFSHEHHVNELGIDCRYCHTSVEKSSFAGLPPTHTCMTCHSQVWTNSPLLAPVRDSYATGQPLVWNRVNKLPDFVYFNHSIHINKGIGCNECHGQVNRMQITYKGKAFFMSFCLNCHRNVENYIRPRDQVFNLDYVHPQNQAAMGAQLVKQYQVNKSQLQDCWVCHR